MSHAHGQVILSGKVVGYYEYNGTCDIAISHIYDTEQAVVDNWRSHRWSDCTCGNPPVGVLLYTDYGGGFYWPGKVCLQCRAIVEGLEPYPCDGEEPVVTHGYPLDSMEKTDDQTTRG